MIKSNLFLLGEVIININNLHQSMKKKDIYLSNNYGWIKYKKYSIKEIYFHNASIKVSILHLYFSKLLYIPILN